VLIQLGPFLIMLSLVLLMFSYAVHFLFRETPYCNNSSEFNTLDSCKLETSTFSMMTMMMGEMGSISEYVSEVDGVVSTEDYIFELTFVFYGFIVVIVLSNMLIAITTDSYAFIKNERAVMVFWSNRLDQVAENYVFVAILRKLFRREKKKEVQLVGPTTVQERPGSKGITTEGGYTSQTHRGLERVLYNYWEGLLDIFSDNMEARSRSYFSFDFLLILCTRLLVIVIISIWLLVGLATLTVLWPPQIREMCLGHEITATSNNITGEVLLLLLLLLSSLLLLRTSVTWWLSFDMVVVNFEYCGRIE